MSQVLSQWFLKLLALEVTGTPSWWDQKLQFLNVILVLFKLQVVKGTGAPNRWFLKSVFRVTAS